MADLSEQAIEQRKGEAAEVEADLSECKAALQRILDHGQTHEEPCWALHQGDCADVFQEIARAALARLQQEEPGG